VNLDTIDFTGAGTATLQLGVSGDAPANGTWTAFTPVLGGKSGSSGTINVGFGSTLSVQWSLTLGGSGTGNLFVGSGGQVTTNLDVVMAAHSGSSSTVVVTDPGSKLTINGSASNGLTVGGPILGGVGSLIVQKGSQVLIHGGDLSINSPSQTTPSTVSVSGAGSSLVLDDLIEGNLRAGDSSGRGQVIVSNGGFLRSCAGYVGGAVGTTGEVTVTGANSDWVVLRTGQDAILEVGRYLGTTGTLTVSDGGVVGVFGQTTVGLSGGAGTIVLDGGTLVTGPSLPGTGPLLVGPTGTLKSGPAGPLPSVLRLGAGTSVVAGKVDLRGANGTPGALVVEFVQPSGQSAGLAVGGQIQLAFATTLPGSVGGPPGTNGASSAPLGTGAGNSLLSLIGAGTLDLTGATFQLFGGSGLAANWDQTRYYSWKVMQLPSGVAVTGLDAATVDASQFGQPTGSGVFFLTADAAGVYIAFSPVPEPATVLGIASGALAFGAGIRCRPRRGSLSG